MSISGLVIHARPDKVSSTEKALAEMPGVEVHAATGDGRLVVTVDCPSDDEAANILFQLRDLDGVLDTSLVYNFFDQQPTPAQ